MSIVADTETPASRPTDPLLEIYLERRANLVRFFAARSGSRLVAEDLAQELYVKLATRDPAVTAENPVALIYRIATNLMLDRARGEARATARDAAWRRVTHASMGGEDVAEEIPADEAVASRQRLRQLVEAAGELPPQMQRAFRLHKLEGHSHAETARGHGHIRQIGREARIGRPQGAHREARPMIYRKLHQATGGSAGRGVYSCDGPPHAAAVEGLMSKVWRYGDDARREDAAAWVVRVEAGELGEAEAVAFDTWLSAMPENALAFDAALAVSHAYAAAGEHVARHLSDRRARPAVGRRAFLGFGAVAAAAALAVVIAPQFSQSNIDTYATAKGQRSTIRLADGSTIDLNGGTRLSVSLGRDGRHVSLAEGQAVFDVAHDARRPFLIDVGDRVVRVVGTQFDVRRLDGKLSVTVARGAVEVRPTGAPPARPIAFTPASGWITSTAKPRPASPQPSQPRCWAGAPDAWFIGNSH